MEEMAKIEAKGDASQEELEALAADLSSKVGRSHSYSEPKRQRLPLCRSSFC